MNAKIDTVVIDSVKTQFGKEEAIIYGKIYDTVENAKKIEPDYILLRHKLIEKKS
jgi:small subunit ribosomal protein S24e